MPAQIRSLASLLCLAILSGCGSDSMVIGAASSLTDVMRQVEVEFEAAGGNEIDLEFAGSGVLEAQIRAGAPIAVFFAASDQEPLKLHSAGLVQTPVEFAGNRMICATRAALPAIRALSDLTDPRYDRIAIGSPSTVPSGRYAMEILDHTGLQQLLAPRLLPCANVRQALAYLERGDVDAAFLYRTDLNLSDKPLNSFLVPDSLHSPIRYLACVTTRAGERIGAHAFLRFLISEEGQSILQANGFEPPRPGSP